MWLLPDRIPALRLQLAAIEDMRAAVERHAVTATPVEAAVKRLQAQLADLDREATEIANRHPAADESRLAQLIAGEEVRSIDKKAVEGQAVKAALLAAQRAQAARDLDQLRQHLAEVNDVSLRLQQELDRAQLEFLSALGDAVVETYKHNAIEFVRQNMPPLHSIAVQIKQRTGAGPAWAKLIFPGPTVVWLEDETVPDPLRPGTNARVHVRTQLWPLRDGILLSGENVESPAVVDSLIAEIVAHAATPALAPDAG